MLFTKEELKKIREKIIKDSMNECVWQWVNTTLDYPEDSGEYKDAVRIINNFTFDEVVDYANDEILNCYIVNLRKSLTKAEREWATEFAKKLIAEARAYVGIDKEPEAKGDTVIEQEKNLKKIRENVIFAFTQAPHGIKKALETIENDPDTLEEQAQIIKGFAESMMQIAKSFK